MYSNDTSDMIFDLSKNSKQTQCEKVMDSKPAKPDTSSKIVSLISKNTAVSLVDRILLEESSCLLHFKTDTVNKAKRLQKKLCYSCLSTRINDTLFYFQAEKSSTSHKMSHLFENEKRKEKRSAYINRRMKKQKKRSKHGILKNDPCYRKVILQILLK